MDWSSHAKDEILELIWTQAEEGKDDLEHLVETANEADARDIIKALEDDGLVTFKDDRALLTKKGLEAAVGIIRRHRLAERLLSEVFDLEDEYVHREACKFEHILGPEVTDSVCTFLGHPPVCPHGKAIPRGECCAKFKRDVRPLVVPLRDLEPGERGRIVFMTPKEHEVLDRLSTMGLIPGSVITLHQKRPSYVIRVGETDLALDEKIARDIFVKKAE
ncbi:MAG: metal-dependent transcriptional regulator [Euryarchaeota archaeon]|nr:metal-dependent transcriptional regulator [Euryarchaeota archaeon]